MITIFRDQLRYNNVKVLLGNMLSLSVLQLANYILPLLTLPYLLRVLGPKQYGLVVFAQSFIEYFRLSIEFGFALSATKEIAISKNDIEQISKVFFSVIIIKFILFIASILIFIGCIFLIDKIYSERLLFSLTFTMLFGVVLFPSWFFQGMEQMRYITILNVGAKTFFTIMIFIFVKTPNHYYYVPVFNGLGYIVAGLIGIVVAIRKYQLFFPKLKFGELWDRFIYSCQFFASRISTTIFTNTNTFIIGLFLESRTVAYYAAAEKIYNALIMFIQPISASLYPHVAKYRNIDLFKKIFILTCSVFTTGWLIVFCFSGYFINLLFGNQYGVSATILSILSIAGAINIPSILLGFPFLGALGHEKIANLSVIFAALIHFILLIALIPFLNIYIVAKLVVFTQILILSIRLYAIKKNYA